MDGTVGQGGLKRRKTTSFSEARRHVCGGSCRDEGQSGQAGAQVASGPNLRSC